VIFLFFLSFQESPFPPRSSPSPCWTWEVIEWLPLGSGLPDVFFSPLLPFAFFYFSFLIAAIAVQLNTIVGASLLLFFSFFFPSSPFSLPGFLLSLRAAGSQMVKEAGNKDNLWKCPG